MNLVRYDQDITTMAELGQTSQGLTIPCNTGRIVRIGQYQQFAFFIGHFLKIFKIHPVSTVFFNKRIINHFTLISQRRETKRMIHGRLYYNLLVFSDKHVDHHADAFYNSGYIRQPFAFYLPAMMRRDPIDDTVPIFLGSNRITENGMLQTPAQSLDNEVGCFKIHVGHPQRNQILSSIKSFQHIIF